MLPVKIHYRPMYCRPIRIAVAFFLLLRSLLDRGTGFCYNFFLNFVYYVAYKKTQKVKVFLNTYKNLQKLNFIKLLNFVILNEKIRLT